MASNILALYAEAWTAPRQSMRRILGLSLTERDKLIMVAITGVLFAIPVASALKSIEPPMGPDGTPIAVPSTFSTAIFTVGFVILGYYITAAVLKVIGSVMGGQASYVQCKTVSAWSQFVIGLANFALLLVSTVMPYALDIVLRLIFTVGSLYVFSSYVAEAHGFRNVVKVVGVMLGLSILLSLVLMSLLPAAMLPRPQ